MQKAIEVLTLIIGVTCFFLFALLGYVGFAYAQPMQSIKIDFSWAHNGEYTTGFRLYKGTSPNVFVKAVDIPGPTVRSYTFTSTENLPICFGMSAYGPSGESALITKTPGGVDVCVGKPAPLSSFLFSVQ